MGRIAESNYHQIIRHAVNTCSDEPEAAWEIVRHHLDMYLRTQPVRVHDSDNEGIFTSGKRPPAAECDSSKLEKEEGLSYAFFNSRHELDIHIQGKTIAYEAYLLRQPKKFGPAVPVKCDLVVYHPKNQRLTALEVKRDPGRDPRRGDTSIMFGMLQAKGYGYLLVRHHAAEMERLKAHVSHCLGIYHGDANAKADIKSIRFALGAPTEYFQRSLLQSAEVIEYLRALEQRYFSLEFGGYWAIDGNIEKQPAGQEKCQPHLVNPNVQCFETIEDLLSALQ